MKQNGKNSDESEYQSSDLIERKGDDDIAARIVSTKPHMSGYPTGVSGHTAGPITDNHHIPSELEQSIISGADNGTRLK